MNNTRCTVGKNYHKINYHNVKLIWPYIKLMSKEQSNLHINFFKVSKMCKKNMLNLSEEISQQLN